MLRQASAEVGALVVILQQPTISLQYYHCSVLLHSTGYDEEKLFKNLSRRNHISKIQRINVTRTSEMKTSSKHEQAWQRRIHIQTSQYLNAFVITPQFVLYT